jgi:mRNA interferase HigB
LKEFAQLHPDAATGLNNWYKVALSAQWKNLTQVRQILSSAEGVGKFTVLILKVMTID